MSKDGLCALVEDALVIKCVRQSFYFYKIVIYTCHISELQI